MTAMHKGVAMRRAPATEPARFQKGSVMIEFAIILPLFLALLFGVISFSAALYNKTVLTTATREGARAGVVFVQDRDDDEKESIATTTAQAYLSDNLISFGPATPDVESNINGDILTVTASSNFTGVFVFSDLLLSAETSMRLE